MANYAIIPSGGVGKRINSSLPKQYIKIKGKELIAYTLEIFQKCESIDKIIVAVTATDEEDQPKADQDYC